MMLKRLLRFGALTPVLLLGLLPAAASADAGLAVSVRSPATRASLGLLVPISVTCPAPSSDPATSQSLSGTLQVIQTNGNSNVAVGVATLSSGGKGAFGSPQPGVDLICDGSAHAYQALVMPDAQTYPLTAAFTGGPAPAPLSTGLFTFTCPPWLSPPTQNIATGTAAMHSNA